MIICDAHCDTLTKFPHSFVNATNHWSLDRFMNVGGRIQFFAIYTPPTHSDSVATAFAFNAIGDFHKNKSNNMYLLENSDDIDLDKCGIILSLEGVSPVINSLELLHAFYKSGLRACGLTWNHSNYAAQGTWGKSGLSIFGKQLIAEMDKLNMIIDVSHLSDAGFDDVANYANGSFIASHSNSRSVLDHLRNLTDEQIITIKERNGFIGLNFYTEFIASNNDDMEVQFYKHIEHFLALGCEDILGLGADYDGIDSGVYNSVEEYNIMAEKLSNVLKLNDSTIEKIMGLNLLKFLRTKL